VTARKLSPTCGPRTLLAKTCNKCYQLKSGDQFSTLVVAGIRYYQTACKICELDRGNKRRGSKNTASLEHAKQHRTEWSPSEIQTMLALRKMGFSFELIAKRLGRSISAIRNAHHKHKE
jgi:hypothetical protein